jgi:hypothetical protein
VFSLLCGGFPQLFTAEKGGNGVFAEGEGINILIE